MPFHRVDGAHVVLKTKGVFRQLDVYTFRGMLWAKKGGGFVPLYRRGTNSADDVLIEFYLGVGELYEGPLGRLCTVHRAGFVKVAKGWIENVIL